MLDLFKKKNINKDDMDIISKTASLLIHAAKIDENYSKKEKNIIEKTILELGADPKKLPQMIAKAEKNEQNSNQILDFTKEIKNTNEEFKKKNN